MFGHDDSNNDNHQDDAGLPVVTTDNPGPPPVADGTLDSTATGTSSLAPSTSFPNLPTRPSSDDDQNGGDNDNLLAVKQQVLQDLHPLVNHLDQTPEEKFKTLMMMIQASDDKNLVHSAYEAAKSIPDEKVRAQALLDVVNEINYFTQPKS